MRRLTLWATALAAMLGAVALTSGAAQGFIGKSPAPEFPPGLDWVNTGEPLTLAQLRGKVVLLDFWTYGCINCSHVIPDLRALGEKYPNELVIIGVHSAKFLNEADSGNIALVAERYGRAEPIVNDAGFDVWRAYGVRAWPTLVLIDPEGKVVGRHEGEGAFGPLDNAIEGMIAAFAERGTLDRRPLTLAADGSAKPRTALRFPEQVLADAATDRLFIADSGNDRIVVTDLGGVVQGVIGTGEAGLADGSFQEAAFRWPHGLALAGPNELYVADTGNHALRLIDLAERTVRTVAGTGEQAYLFNRLSVSAAGGLNSPWDVLWLDGELYVAMAGQHQVWRYDPTEDALHLVAGSGREELRDGDATAAGLNQPTGLATDGTALFVADSEASAIRRVELGADGKVGARVETLVGTGLFDFGDVDGVGDAVLLQHAQAVDFAGGFVYVADTYNHKVKRLDPLTRETVTLLGTGVAGWQDGPGGVARFHEPGGVSVVGQLLYVADTNNHLIRVADLSTLQVRTLELSDPEGLLTGMTMAQAADEGALERFDELVRTPAAAVAVGDGRVSLTLSLPDGYQANDLAPLQVRLRSSAGAVTFAGAPSASVSGPHYPLTLEFPAAFSEGEATVLADVVIYYCRSVTAALCLIRQARLEVPVTVGAAHGDEVGLAWQPPPVPAGR